MRKNLRLMTACLLAGVMALSMAACGSKSDKNEKAAEESTAEVVEETKKNTVASGVQVPENFESMMMPMEALAMESYHLGYPYYIQFSEGSSRDSFWYSTALTAYYLHSDETKPRISVSQDECDMIISALYASYQQGNLEIPEIRNGVSYAAYDDENGGYFFSKNDTDYVPQKLSDYYLNVVSCEQSADGYVVKANLMDSSLESSLGEFEYNLVPNIYPGDKNEFAYSISYMSDGSNPNPEQGLAGDSSEGTEGSEQATDEEGNVITEESGEESGEESENEEGTIDTAGEGSDQSGEGSEDAEEISSDRALTIAQENYGPDLQYDYQGVQKLDGYPYHVFAVSGDDARVSYVLVGTNGVDCVGGNRNEDGSWSFDQ